MTLNQQLAALGLTTAPAGHGRRHILDGDRVVFTGRAHDVWAWLRETGRRLLCPDCGMDWLLYGSWEHMVRGGW